jgi:transposase
MDQFWLTDEQFVKIAPHLPTNTRGKPRVDNCRVISGIIHVLKSGGRWVDAPAVYGPRRPSTTASSAGPLRACGWTCSTRSLRPADHRSGADRLLRGEGAPLRFRRPRVECAQAIGRSRGGRSTKIHALADRLCRPITFLITGGQIADCTAGALLLERLPACRLLHADKGYDSDAIRRQVEARGTAPNIPAQSQPGLEAVFLACAQSLPQRHRAHVLPLEGLPACGYPLRSAGHQLSRNRLPRRHRQLLVMNPDHRPRR